MFSLTAVNVNTLDIFGLFAHPDNNRQSGKKYAVFYKIRLARIILNIIGGRVLKIVFKCKLIAVNHSQTASLFVQRQNTDFRPVAVLPGFFKIITGLLQLQHTALTKYYYVVFQVQRAVNNAAEPVVGRFIDIVPVGNKSFQLINFQQHGRSGKALLQQRLDARGFAGAGRRKNENHTGLFICRNLSFTGKKIVTNLNKMFLFQSIHQ